MARYERLDEGAIANVAEKLAHAKRFLGVSLSEVARRAGVSQPMAWSVMRGKIRVRTPNLRKLELFIHIALGEHEEDVRSLDQAILDFLGAGGSVSELRSIIVACTQARRHWNTPN